MEPASWFSKARSSFGTLCGLTIKVTPRQLATFAAKHLGPAICRKSGQVLYSGVDTLRPGSLYLLGHNPGSEPTNRRLMTIGASLDSLPTNKKNAYLDATFVGRDTLQRRVIWLTAALGFNPREVAASNLVFVRSRDAESMPFLKYAELCWPIHVEILKIIQPRMVLVYGNSSGSPYSFLSTKFGVRTEKWYNSGQAAWKCRTFRVPGSFRVVGLPHLSRYDVTAHCDVVGWINNLA